MAKEGIARQGVLYSLIGYLGFIIGAAASYLLFPQDFKFYGTLSYILTTAEIVVPLAVFGISYANVKFFEQQQRIGRHTNMFWLSAAAIFVNFLLIAGIVWLLPAAIPNMKKQEWYGYRYYILSLIFFLSQSHLINRFLTNYKKIAIPNIFENIFPKMANILAFSAVVYGGLQPRGGFLIFTAVFAVSWLLYLVYLHRHVPLRPDFRVDYFRNRAIWNPIFSYSFFGFLGNIGNYIAIKIDKWMIGDHLGMEELGIYSTIYAMISLITIPQLGLFSISSPVINKAFLDRDMASLDRFHKKTSLTLFALGSVLFSLLLVGFPYLTHYIGEKGEILRESAPVVWILGSAILIDLATGFNGNIISMSKYYRFNIIIMVFLGVLTIVLNYLFLRYTGLRTIGVALATGISLTVYNLVKILFNYKKFSVHPLSIEMAYLMALCTLAVTLGLLLPESSVPFFTLLYKCAVVLGLIVLGNFYLQIIPTDTVLNYFRKKNH